MLTPGTPPHTFLPWLLTQCNGRIVNSPVNYFGRIASEPRPPTSPRLGIVLAETGTSSTLGERNWVGDADGRSAWLFAGGPEPALLNLVTGAVSTLPPFRIYEDDWSTSNPHGIMYGDGTIFLYTFDSVSSTRGRYRYHNQYRTAFKAAILRPGDKTWTALETRLTLPAAYHSCTAYHGGKVLVWVGMYFWCVVTPHFGANRGNNTTNGSLETTWDKQEDEYYTRDHSYVLESNVELLWASILVKRDKDYPRRHAAAPTLAVRVHVLEEEEEEAGGGDGRKMRWVERDDQSLGDRVLFLGSPVSFAVNAAELGLDGGCAYFVFNGHVLRYCFVHGETKPVEWVSPGQSSRKKARLWLRPAPTVLEIQDRHETPNGK
jgi:hypothetical protein